MVSFDRVIRRLSLQYLRLTAKFRSDKNRLKVLYRIKFGRELDLNNPKSFNEKLNWMKLYYRNPNLTLMADKFAVKEYVANIIGSEYVVKCYGVWDDPDEINFMNLPNSFVLKTTHDSGGVIIVKDKSKLNLRKIKKQLNKWLKNSHFLNYGEWVYKNIKPRIIAEELLIIDNEEQILDYKFWCFGGVPKSMYISIKNNNIFENHYDMSFNILNINHGFNRRLPEFSKPHNFELMIELATLLSRDLPFVRVDFYNVNGKIYFGEFTFYDWGGMKPFNSYEQDILIGEQIKLPNIS